MYSNDNYYNHNTHPSAPSNPATLSNNPFISDQTGSAAHTRYPDISSPSLSSSSPSSSQYTSWLQPQSPTASGYNNNFQQQQQGYLSPQGQGQGQQGFLPSSAFGQQLVTQLNTGYFPQQQQQQSQSQFTGYPGQQQQQAYLGGGYPQQQQPSYTDLAQFDPYSSISQGWDPSAPSPSQSSQARSTPGATSSTTPTGQPHPRDYIRTHKAELEAWDQYAWKQLLNAFEALKGAWEGRRGEVRARLSAMGGAGYGGGGWGGGYGYGGEAGRLQQLLKEADSNFDSVAASSFQMTEVRTGYRQSGDAASKRRVRESCNAALSSLPEWPPAQW